MGNVVNISSHPKHDPTRINITSKLLRLSNATKKDVSRLLSLSHKDVISDYEKNIISETRKCIFLRLESIAGLIAVANAQGEEWDNILRYTLSKVYKHSHPDEISHQLSILLQSHQGDTSPSGIHFLLTYMEIVARIPSHKIIQIFNLHK